MYEINISFIFNIKLLISNKLACSYDERWLDNKTRVYVLCNAQQGFVVSK